MSDIGVDLIFEAHWGKPLDGRSDVLEFWKQHAPALGASRADQRLEQLVFVVRRKSDGKIIAESTAEKVKIKQLRNYLYNIRAMVVRDSPVSPGLLAKLLDKTFSQLELANKDDVNEPAIGVIALIENDELKRVLTKAVLSASGLVYIGTSPRGHHIRVRYFDGAMIN